jgi:TetR/AcrR family transcriptional regulator, tetracycline repressor protein
MRRDAAADRTGLSREEVASAALVLLDREGLEALSMRRLAKELGVGTMTLYGYFRSKEELLDAVVDLAVAEQELPALEGPWRERLWRLAKAARSNLARHPGLVHIRAVQPVLRPEALRMAEIGMGILEDAGFEPAEAAKGFRLLFTYTLGFTLFSPETAEEQAREAAQKALSELPPEYYPRLLAAVDEAADAMAGDAVFDYGLERILDGFEARLAALS